MQRVATSRPFLALAILTYSFACTGCTALDSSGGGDERQLESPDAQEDSDAREIAAAELDLELGRARLALQIAEQKAAVQKQASRLAEAQAEVELAEASAAHFQEIEAPNKLAREKLDLRSVKDRAREAAEELEQIQIMYKDQDLDDLTAEFVVSRGKRNAQRAAARIEIEEENLRGLEEHELPLAGKRLELALQKAVDNLKQLQREGENSAEAKAISVKEARGKVTHLEGELEDLRRGKS